MILSFLVGFFGKCFYFRYLCFLENTTSPRFLINALLQFLEKSLRDIQNSMYNFTKKEAMLQYILGASVKQELDI